MALKIRLRRMGRKKAPHYRIVIAESTMPRDGRFVATIGHYNPTTTPEVLKVDRDKALAWIAKGAMPTDTVRSLLRKAGVFSGEPGVAETAATVVKGAAGKVADAARSAASTVAAAATAAAGTVASAASAAVETVREAVSGGGDAAPAAAEADATPAAAETDAAPAAAEETSESDAGAGTDDAAPAAETEQA